MALPCEKCGNKLNGRCTNFEGDKRTVRITTPGGFVDHTEILWHLPFEDAWEICRGEYLFVPYRGEVFMPVPIRGEAGP